MKIRITAVLVAFWINNLLDTDKKCLASFARYFNYCSSRRQTNTKLTNSKAANLNNDGVVDVFDLVLLKKMLLEKQILPVQAIMIN